MRVFITGCNSFTGKHLARTVQAGSSEAVLFGMDRVDGAPEGLASFQVDITDAPAVARVVAEVRPDVVLHLAGVRSRDRDLSFQVNVNGTRNLLEACAALASPPRVVAVSSAAVYGRVPAGRNPVTEDEPLRPLDAYGASKAAMEASALGIADVPVLVARPFNLIGPGLPSGLAATDFLLTARRARAAGTSTLPVGNLDSFRDLIDVRDVAEALWRLARQPGVEGQVFNIATGAGTSMRELFEAAFAVTGVSVRTEPDPARMRPSDVPELTGDASRLRAATGWSPQVSWQDSLRDLARELEARPGL